MSDGHYRVIEVVGASTSSIDDAVRAAIDHAAAKDRLIAWFQVVDTRGHVVRGAVANYQVTLRVGFTLDQARGG